MKQIIQKRFKDDEIFVYQDPENPEVYYEIKKMYKPVRFQIT